MPAARQSRRPLVLEVAERPPSRDLYSDVVQGKSHAVSAEGLVVAPSDQDPVVVDLRSPGGESRFTFGTPGLRSSIWKLVVTKSGEVYLMERGVGRDLKFSLHRSGDWRFAWTEKRGALTPSGENWAATYGGRIVDRWRRPAPQNGHYTMAISIRVGSGELRPTNDDQSLHGEVDFCTPPPPGRVGVFTIMLCTPDPDGFVVSNAAMIAAFSTRTSYSVVAMASHADPSPGELELIDGLRTEAQRLQYERHGRGVSELGDYRAFLSMPLADDRRALWEVALD